MKPFLFSFTEYREGIPFLNPAPIEVEETKKQKKQKEGMKNKTAESG